MICDALENLNRYRGLHKNLETAIVRPHRLPCGPRPERPSAGPHRGGRRECLHQRDGGRAEPRQCRPRVPAEGGPADLQIDLTGGEGWGCARTCPARKRGEFAGDIGFRTSPDAVSGVLGEGRFVLFFPGELHKPGVARPAVTMCAKAVVRRRPGWRTDGYGKRKAV